MIAASASAGTGIESEKRAAQFGVVARRALLPHERVDARSDASVARSSAGALVDFLRDGDLHRAEHVVLERRHFRRRAVRDEDARFQLLSGRQRDLRLALVLEARQLRLQAREAQLWFLAARVARARANG